MDMADIFETGLTVRIARKVTFLKSGSFRASFPFISFKQSIIRWKLLDTAKQWTQIKGSFNNILFSKFNQEKYLTQREISLVTCDKPINL